MTKPKSRPLVGARLRAIGSAAISASLLSACSLAGIGGPYPGVPELLSPTSLPPPYTGPVPAPQVVYRIDESRYFEVVPREAGACTDATLFYADKAKGIRSRVREYQRGVMTGAKVVIDAANDQYLVGPMSRGSLDCSSGGGYCSGPGLYFSTDSGRSWQRGEPVTSPSRPLHLVGSRLYAIGATELTRFVDLADGRFAIQDWKPLPNRAGPPAAKQAPLDTTFNCVPNGKE